MSYNKKRPQESLDFLLAPPVPWVTSTPKGSSLASQPSLTSLPSKAISGSREDKKEVFNTSKELPKALANSAMFDPIRYKTEMCKNFVELGSCRFGGKCYYAHYRHELKPITYKHKKYKTELCKPFHSEGFCDFGSRCAYIHTKPVLEDILKQLELFIISKIPMDQFINDPNNRRLRAFENLYEN